LRHNGFFSRLRLIKDPKDRIQMHLESINPSNGELLERFPVWSSDKLDEVIAQVAAQNVLWGGTVSISQRAVILRKVAEILSNRRDELARMMALEMGKPIGAGQAEVEKCAWVCDYYAEHAKEFLADEIIQTDASKSFIRYQPLGTVLAVMPWNYPLWQFFRFGAPALMAGNTIVLKHASNVTLCAIEIEKILLEAGLQENVFRTLLITSKQVNHVINSPHVSAVTLTGSEGAGRAVGEAAGKALKPSVLELGGSDPFIVLEDANIKDAAQTGTLARTLNAGQSCIAAKRFIIETNIYEQFMDAFLSRMKDVVVGDPLNSDTQVGPLARHDLRDELHMQVESSIKAGAELMLGGEIPSGLGAFYPVTVLANVKPGMPAYDEEMFGPVAACIRVKDQEEAIRVANDTKFGLGASLWTTNLEAAYKLVNRIESGAVFINGLVKSDPRLPFGGIKASGYGRELSAQGIREFVNIKTVWTA
jgi:succinate-semialdehyde dehydrogenase / glutarate-semialdehyde dehydrogenase